MSESLIPSFTELNLATISSIIAAAIIGIANIAFLVARKQFREQRHRGYIAYWMRLLIVYIVGLFVTFFFLDRSKFIEAVAGVSVVCLAVAIFKLYRVGKIGIYDFDVSVKGGFDYASALRSARHNICFVGTGASKLTSSDEFETALERCQMGVKNRFLLIHPDSPVLKHAAQQAGVREDEYASKVRGSVERLATLATRRNFKIEVRFQDADREDDLESFRLMFIDDRVCLFSFNAYGRGDGSALPQLIVQAKSRAQEERTFYYGLRRYFDRRWSGAKAWDVHEFTGGRS